ncbi:MAG: ATP-binding cassette domain-containing protein [candidate division NC10 bacterium]|nr:ATP-binding cassette domain-containing protein [candidate division NC10 bacterium]
MSRGAPGTGTAAVEVEGLRHLYGSREALAGVTFRVSRGEIFGFLGPNGGGKTTLFKILATLMPPTGGTVRLLGRDLQGDLRAVRRGLGVVFQRASVDPKLTVAENLRHHGHLYGLRGPALRAQGHALLTRLGLADRAADLVETLSGGLQRRVELAKGLLPRPDLLLLDEPTTGLDPGARRDFMAHLHERRAGDGVTILLTTHFFEEAERCDRIGILHRGRLVATGAPEDLKGRIGGDVVEVRAKDPEGLRKQIRERFGGEPVLVDGTLRLERPRGHEFARELVEAFPGEVQGVTFGKPTLEDVFVHLTGHRFWGEAPTGGGGT